MDIQKRLELEAAAREEGSDIFYEAADEIARLRENITLLDGLWHEYHDAYVSQLEENDRLRELIAEWKEEPVGGISKFGVVYLSPERVAAIVDPLKESLRIADAACRTYWGWEYGRPGDEDDDDIPNSSLLVKWRADYVKRK